MGCIHDSTTALELQENLDEYRIPGGVLSGDNLKVSPQCIDESKYHDFLKNLYKQMLLSYVYLQYADAENGISSKYKFIYEYI